MQQTNNEQLNPNLYDAVFTERNYMEVLKIYFDMDDTLADFSLGIQEICGLEHIPQDKSSEKQDDIMWAAVRDAGDFYYRLKECETGMTLFRKLYAEYGDKVEILTAVPKPKRQITTAEDDKKRWVREHLGNDIVVNVVHSADDKKNMCKGPGYILIDDLQKNILGWRKAGGTAIWFLKNSPAYVELEVVYSGLFGDRDSALEDFFNSLNADGDSTEKFLKDEELLICPNPTSLINNYLKNNNIKKESIHSLDDLLGTISGIIPKEQYDENK